ncbi:helix-turn-helix domain-containing protein [Terrabacter sp. C0L_2]|uniref:helix-turn-helix domain-containing protein n=1 Tax=Terrabacter sp. C0L_2 TaxID=3108389 RepID=UPI002ED1F69F|nr:helix-turn-helix domain-containing protein [Terrabacter sp. C0L_2]
MATTAADLIDQARRVLAELQQTGAPMSREHWESFDQTVYRLLHELDSAVTGWLSSQDGAAQLHQAMRDFPRPLQPVDDRPDFSIKEAARLLGTSDNVVRNRITAGALLAAPTGNGYRIPRSEVTARRDVPSASTDDPHPIARLSCILGALNDLLVLHRLDAASPQLQTQAALTLATQTLSITAAAARRALALCDPVAADRPLLIARYAGTAASTLPAASPLRGLQNPAIPAPAQALNTPGAVLERSLHDWASAARDELRDAVPSVAVLQDINRQGVHLYAALDAVLGSEPDSDHTRSREQLRTSARSLQSAADVWKQTSTGMPPSRAYVEAARRLNTALSRITLTTGAEREHPADAYQVLLRGASDVAWLTTQVAPFASQLHHSGVLFIHARHAHNDPSRLSAKLGGRMVEATARDLPNLIDALRSAQASAADAARMLPAELAPSHICRAEVHAPAI